MVQTPQQRRANERYAKAEAAKRGKPEGAVKLKPSIKDKKASSSPISRGWIILLGFVLAGGAVFELLRLFGF